MDISNPAVIRKPEKKMLHPVAITLLAFLATGKVNFIEWLKFILPLVLILTVLSLGIMAYAISIGY